jgi:hypothetical protein
MGDIDDYRTVRELMWKDTHALTATLLLATLNTMGVPKAEFLVGEWLNCGYFPSTLRWADHILCAAWAALPHAERLRHVDERPMDSEYDATQPCPERRNADDP